jgi:Capsular polysaccharide synthesis protein
MQLNKTIWLLWIQGWDKAPWLQQMVLKSWRINNPTWNIVTLSNENLDEYVTDCPYLFNPLKRITVQAASDIIRLSLLKNHGGVWADSTMLCMQPLDNWLNEEMMRGSLWMYHGGGGGMPEQEGPASWFIVSLANGPLISKWKAACDNYWQSRIGAHEYFWMDGLFRQLYESDPEFKAEWLKVPNICCEAKGQAHALAYTMFENTPELKELITKSPPFAFKLSKNWTLRYKNELPAEVLLTNGYHAIQRSGALS